MNAPAPTQRVLPHNLDAEGAVLSAAMLSAEACDEIVATLDPDDFYSGSNRHVFAAVQALARDGIDVDAVAVAERLRRDGRLEAIGGAAYLALLTDATPAVSHVIDHARIVQDLARVRRAIRTFQQLAAEGYGDVGNVREWLEYCEAACYTATGDHVDVQASVAAYREIAAQTVAIISERSTAPTEFGVRTGFSLLDQHTGGLHDGHLWYVGGRPGSGKTSWVMQAIEHAAAFGHGAIVFSLEMQRAELMMRSLARRARVPGRALSGGRLSHDDWSRVTQSATSVGELPVVVDDSEELTPLRLRARLRRHAATLRQRGVPLRLVAIDYVQLMAGDQTRGNRNEELTAISRMLKRTAKQFGCTVIALSQLTRPQKGAGDKRPELHDLRESGALEQDADVVMFIHRPDAYRPIEDRTGDAELYVAKGRNCGAASFDVKFDGRFTSFENA